MPEGSFLECFGYVLALVPQPRLFGFVTLGRAPFGLGYDRLGYDRLGYDRLGI
jgi:hypothetical protein